MAPHRSSFTTEWSLGQDGKTTQPNLNKSEQIRAIIGSYCTMVENHMDTEFEWATVRGGIHGGTKSSEPHPHLTVELKTVGMRARGTNRTAHIALTRDHLIDWHSCKLFPEGNDKPGRFPPFRVNLAPRTHRNQRPLPALPRIMEDMPVLRREEL
ncbi:hypothetical protein ABW20_dc0106573 [Dactylellina cionopaga]|nr:hypothetical protein ABW20_dc0106573 [Dactylellina cionopaga]